MLEEPDHKVREFMLQYQGNLMQDALELSWPTVKRAHVAVLTELEKGTVTNRNRPDLPAIHSEDPEILYKPTRGANVSYLQAVQ